MFARGKRGELRRIIADFLMALALFWGAVFAFGGSHNYAHAVAPLEGRPASLSSEMTAARAYMPAAASLGLPLAHNVQASRQQSMVLLSVAFAAIVALNLAFLRHLRRVYASPRRSVWRRG